MRRPDFARTELMPLVDGDLRFLIESFPQPATSYEEIAGILDALPNTLESMLTSDTVVQQIIFDRARLLRISPFLLFNVLLRQVLADHRRPEERRVVNYLANLMALFVTQHRLYRIDSTDAEAYGYLVDLIEQAVGADPDRRFLVHAHVANFSLFMTGMFGTYLEERFRHGRRTVGTSYYADLGSSSYSQASALPPAQAYRLTEVFVRLALTFDSYRRALGTIADSYLH
jgi:hypothetical protein